MDERELILLVRQGDEHAFETLVRQYEKKVYTLCYRMCGNAEDAQEAAQDAFLAAWRGISAFRGDASFSTWLYRLASNACIDLLRRGRHGAGNVSLDDEALFLPVPDPAPQPQEAAERSEAQRMIREGLCALPAEFRRVLVLREIEGLSYGEIAQATGTELGTVKSRINRARALLRNYLTVSGNFFTEGSSKITECNRKEESAQ